MQECKISLVRSSIYSIILQSQPTNFTRHINNGARCLIKYFQAPLSLPWQRGRGHFDSCLLSPSTGIFVNRIYTEIICRVGLNGWMDELRFNVPFNSISFISGRWKGEHEKVCAMKRHLDSEIISPPAGLEPEATRSKVGNANRSATMSLLQLGSNLTGRHVSLILD